MSEPIKGLNANTTVAPLRDAAVVILYRKNAGGHELFWLKRDKGMAFAGGFYAFPGGGVDDKDADIPVAGASPEEARLIGAAARELFEETGVLIAHGPQALGGSVLADAREELLLKKTDFASFLKANHLAIEKKLFVEAGRWVTPEYMPVRFDARFFLVEAPANAVAHVDAREASLGEWIRPSGALHKWTYGTALLHPPNLHVMRVMSSFRDVENAVHELKNPKGCKNFVAQRLEFQKGVTIFPLKTNTLPPATHTNCYLLGERELLLVDPGPEDKNEQERLIALIDELKTEGRHIRAIVLTHHHNDHTAALKPLVKMTRAPVFAHQYTASRMNVQSDRLMEDGHAIVLEGDFRMHWNVLHTPGHAKGHICLVEANSRCAIVGDMVAGIGTIVIETPEGDMAHYMAQLKRLKALNLTTLYPAHGPVIAEASQKLGEYISHREMRERRIMSSLGGEPKAVAVIAKESYEDTPGVFLPLAEMMTLAVLEKLEQEKVAQRIPEGWMIK